MKHGILSVLVACLGFLFLTYITFQIVDMFEALAKHQQLEPHLIVTPKIYNITSLIIGLIGVFFGIKGLQKSKLLSAIGIILSLLLIVFSFIPFWKYFITIPA